MSLGSASTPQRGDPRWCHAAFALLLAAYLVPIWAFPFFPTQDGPSHLANALILADYDANPLYGQIYELNLRPFPNWFSHAVLEVMMGATPPLAAEKLLISLYLVAFVIAFSYLLRGLVPDPGALVLLAFPFACNYLLHMGFYNFAFSVVLYLVTLAYWWRRRDALRGRDALVLNLLLVAGYFCHIVGNLLTIGSVLGLALLTARSRDARANAAPFWMLAPSYLLPGLYLARELHSLGGPGPELGGLYELLSMGWLASYELQRWSIGWPTALLLGALAGLAACAFLPQGGRSAARVRPSDAFAVLAALLAVACLVAPDAIGAGAFVKTRLALFVPLVGVAAIAPRLALRRSPGLGAAVVALALGQLAANVHYYAVANADLEEYVGGPSVLEPGDRILPLTFHERGSLPGSRIGYLRHAGSYYAVLAPVVNTWNYEAETDYFPVVYRGADQPGVDRPDPTQIGHHLEGFEPARFRHRIDVIVAWELETRPALREKVERVYAPVYTSSGGRLRIFRRRE